MSAVLLSNYGYVEPSTTTEADLQEVEMNEEIIMMLKSNLQPSSRCLAKVEAIEVVYGYILKNFEEGKDPVEAINAHHVFRHCGTACGHQKKRCSTQFLL